MELRGGDELKMIARSVALLGVCGSRSGKIRAIGIRSACEYVIQGSAETDKES